MASYWGDYSGFKTTGGTYDDYLKNWSYDAWLSGGKQGGDWGTAKQNISEPATQTPSVVPQQTVDTTSKPSLAPSTSSSSSSKSVKSLTGTKTQNTVAAPKITGVPSVQSTPGWEQAFAKLEADLARNKAEQAKTDKYNNQIMDYRKQSLNNLYAPISRGEAPPGIYGELVKGYDEPLMTQRIKELAQPLAESLGAMGLGESSNLNTAVTDSAQKAMLESDARKRSGMQYALGLLSQAPDDFYQAQGPLTTDAFGTIMDYLDLDRNKQQDAFGNYLGLRQQNTAESQWATERSDELRREQEAKKQAEAEKTQKMFDDMRNIGLQQQLRNQTAVNRSSSLPQDINEIMREMRQYGLLNSQINPGNTIISGITEDPRAAKAMLMNQLQIDGQVDPSSVWFPDTSGSVQKVAPSKAEQEAAELDKIVGNKKESTEMKGSVDPKLNDYYNQLIYNRSKYGKNISGINPKDKEEYNKLYGGK